MECSLGLFSPKISQSLLLGMTIIVQGQFGQKAKKCALDLHVPVMSTVPFLHPLELLGSSNIAGG